MFMNQPPEHLRTPLTRPFAPTTSSIPDHLISGQQHLHSPPTRPFAPPSLPWFPDVAIFAPPDLLNDKTLLHPSPQTVSSRGEPTAFALVSPIRAPFHPGPGLFVPAESQRSYQLSPSSHVTTPKGGDRVHLAEHKAVDRIAYSRAELPRNLPVRVYFLRQFRHARKPELRGQVSRWLICLVETLP
jgi:hypothetical protein